MKFKFLLNHTETLIRQAVFRFWLRTVCVGFIVVLAMFCGLFGCMLFTNQSDWEVGALGAILVVAIVLVAIIYFVHYKRSIGKFRAMASLVATLEVSELEFSFSTSLGTSTLKWSAISEVWIFENMWFFLFSKAQLSTIPLVGIPNEAKDYILSKVKSSGGKIG